MTGAATKNGRPIPTVNGTAFDEGEKCGIAHFDFDDQDRDFAEQQREIGRREVMVDKLEIVRKVIGLIFKDSNPHMSGDAYKFAAGQTKANEVQLGGKYGVTKQAFSKRVKEWQKLLDLPPLGAMRSEKACRKFKQLTTESWRRRQAIT